jgi:hypothetical protein
MMTDHEADQTYDDSPTVYCADEHEAHSDDESANDEELEQLVRGWLAFAPHLPRTA